MQEKTNKHREDGPSVTQKQVEIFILSILLTLLCYGIVQKWVIPGVGFIRYFATEIIIALSIKLVAYITKHKK